MLILFDIDGTLTISGKQLDDDIINILEKLSERYVLGVVSGGKFDKIKWQLRNAEKYFKYIFAECGSVLYIDSNLVYENKILNNCNLNVLNEIIKKSLYEISKMPILYNGGQIDMRSGLVYISPPGIQSSDYERNFFIKIDEEQHLRMNLLTELKNIDTKDEFDIVLGGSVGISVYPKGWDKSQIVNYIKNTSNYDKIYFIGDKTEPTGNDYTLFIHPSINGISVKDVDDTKKKLINF